MGLFDAFVGPDINKGVENWHATPGAVLLDVRTPQEFAVKHIPGAVNVPLQVIYTAYTAIPEKSTPVYVYCRSGARSKTAAAELGRLGYNTVKEIGGIIHWRGPVERSAPV